MTPLNATPRRRLLAGMGATLATASLLPSQQDPFRPHPRVPALDELNAVVDFEAVFHAKLPREIYDYTAYGAEGEFTLRRNREAFGWVELLARGVSDTATVNPETELLGTKCAFPIFLSPSAGHAALHKDGEIATRRGATAASNTLMVVSNVASYPFDQIASAASGPIWFQIYPKEDMDANRDLLEKVQSLGYKAVVITMDQQASYFERPIHDRHLSDSSGPARGRAGRPLKPISNPYRLPENRLFYSWKLVDEIRKAVKVPLLGKGILTAEDAKLCLEHGLDGVYVSNHGGRSLDYDPSTLEVLPEIVDAVQGRVPVLFDSGVRSGADILKALALGAKAAGIGRGVRWGLGAYGAPGVKRVLEILQAELVTAMAQTGRPDLASIDRTLVRTRFR